MMSWLLFLTPVWPLMLVIVLLFVRFLGLGKSAFSLLWLSAPLPALILAAVASGDPAEASLALPWLLMGSLWWLDDVRQVFLLMTSLLWLLAGLYARGYFAMPVEDSAKQARLRAFEYLWLMTLAGNLLLLIAEDIPSFYAGFALMTFSGYGLVIHSRSETALRAGRSYLYLAILGEGLMLAGLLGTAAQAAEPLMSQIPLVLEPDNTSALVLMSCLILGFGVKAGLPLLHVWLPVAHPVAPTPASAVLSGAMIKAGLLGWWLTLPLGTSSWPLVGQALILAGLLAAVAAALLGSLQQQAKAVLAYSSISQMGMMTSLVGVGLSDLTAWPLLIPALLLFVAHHGLNKGGLFLAVGLVERVKTRWLPLLWLPLLLPPLALIGWLGSGPLTKTLMKTSLYAEGWQSLAVALTLAAAGTCLLMLRYLWLLRKAQQQAEHSNQPCVSMVSSWLLLIGLALTLPWWLPLADGDRLSWPDVQGWFDLIWPPLLAFALAWVAWLFTRASDRWQRFAPEAGDLLSLYQRLGTNALQAFSILVTRLERLQQKLSQWVTQLAHLEAFWLRLSKQEMAWRREAALVFSLLVVVLAGLLIL